MALKKQLVAWDFTANSVFADIDSPSKVLKVEGKVVLTVTCDDGQLVCDWVESWKTWALLQDSAELKTIFDKCKNKVKEKGKVKENHSRDSSDRIPQTHHKHAIFGLYAKMRVLIMKTKSHKYLQKHLK